MVSLIQRILPLKNQLNLWPTSRSSSAAISDSFFYFHPSFRNEKEHQLFVESFTVYPDFISRDEEDSLLAEIEPRLRRLRYEVNHWDDAILGYRETEKKDWTEGNRTVLQRVREAAFQNGESMPLVHVLDLKADGVIKPHVDSVKFCGSTIAGLSLLTDSIMRLVREDNSELIVDALLPRRSLYVMTGCSRYKYTHAILADKESTFKDSPVIKDRRISVICRNHPPD